MATGTVKWFVQGLLDIGNKLHSVAADDLRMGIITATVVPTKDTVGPHWGGTGTTNFLTNQVAVTGTSYVAPVILTTKTWVNVSGVPTLRADIITLPLDVSGFTNGAYGIIYNNTDVNKRALGFVELSAAGTASLAAASLVIDWFAATNDILTLTQA